MIDWSKHFPVTTINRADLTEFGLSDDQIKTLFTDEVMRSIADEIQGSYHLHQSFWNDFAQAIKMVVAIEVRRKS